MAIEQRSQAYQFEYGKMQASLFANGSSVRKEILNSNYLIKFPMFEKSLISFVEDMQKKFEHKELSNVVYNGEKNKELDFRHSELECTPASLRGHIANVHFEPDIMDFIGVPRYDIDLAKHRGFRLDWVVRQTYKRLEESSEMVRRKSGFDKFAYKRKVYFERGDAEGYREMLVKTLRYIEEQELASIDWDRVALSVPNLDGIVLDIDRDSTDKPFVARRGLVIV